MTIPFDDSSADALISAATSAASRLRNQGPARRDAAEVALEDFSGRYARLFTLACSTESDDRGTLSRVLEELADQVRTATMRARDERERQAAHAAWQEREDERERRARLAAGGLLQAFTPVLSGPHPFLYDREPSIVPLAPPTVSAAFSAHERVRAEGASASGKSSADPDRLRDFAKRSRSYDATLAAESTRLRNAWAGFTATCSWVPVRTASFVRGFECLLLENQADAAWAENIATAFETAGTGALANSELTLVWAAQIDPAYLQDTLDAMTPAQRAALELLDWLRRSFADKADLPDDPLGLSAWALDHLGTAGETTATWFTRVRFGRLAPRVDGRFTRKAPTRRGRGAQARKPSNWSARPGTAAPYAAWTTAGTWIGRGNVALSGATAAIDQWTKDEGAGYATDERIARSTTRAGLVAVGTYGGALAGLQLGGLIGAAIGPEGAVVGGLVGGIVGGIIGSGVGNVAADYVVDFAGDIGNALGDPVSDLGDALTFWD